MRFLVTGGSGFIGYHLCQALLAGGNHVTILDQITHPAPLLGRVDFLLGHVEHADLLGDIVETKPDVIVHLAAQVGVLGNLTPGLVEEDLCSNVMGTATMAHAASVSGAKLILASSGAMYALPEDLRGPCGWENASSYGISKLAAESYVKLWGERECLSWTILRFSNVYGFQFKPKAVVGTFVKHALEGTQAVIHGDGLQGRDFIHVNDLVSCILAVSARDCGNQQVLDVATGRDVSIRAVWELIHGEVRAAGLNHDIPLPRLDADIPGGASGTMMNVVATEREIGWRAEVQLEDGLRQTVREAVAYCRGETPEAGATWEADYGGMGLSRIRNGLVCGPKKKQCPNCGSVFTEEQESADSEMFYCTSCDGVLEEV